MPPALQGKSLRLLWPTNSINRKIKSGSVCKKSAAGLPRNPGGSEQVLYSRAMGTEHSDPFLTIEGESLLFVRWVDRRVSIHSSSSVDRDQWVVDRGEMR
ncbi:hypothetical protein CEXT_384121 [Caerostris extrusa]|uniref:Uncharacterized protein n=1 Tax=Caerostris extrusa TaxID=172846 RepID=A0AAV4TYG0_CAEEX|nr:hypothetical protein CEXT_384121 [Caerostris extrusa]